MSVSLFRGVILLVCAIVCAALISYDDKVKPCNNANRGTEILYNNRMENHRPLICAKENNVYKWIFIDGSSTYGESFNPAKDCSDVVDNLPNTEDGFYWVSLSKAKPRKVWCDVHTDGGGFTLVGMKDSPELWTVPSNSKPVHPKGPPHWSSALGDVEVHDFAIQVSHNDSFDGTQAHWLYRLKPKRELGKLFLLDKRACTSVHPGIGNVEYVKDILTESEATKNFTCSKFGPYAHPLLPGWGRMNSCLRHDCKNGYAVFPGTSKPLDLFGSFSYSAVSALSGIGHDSTAFVGCDHGQCCACFGPKGGRNNYCGQNCTSINGGRVIKKAFVWFWVRTKMPKRVWKRCMEFKMKNADGKLEKYFINPRTGTAHKGSCSYQFKTFLNEGTLSVADKESLQKIPSVPGLLSYRADNKKLYVNEGLKWDAMSKEKEVLQLKEEVTKLEKILEGYSSSCTALKTDNVTLSNGYYTINQGIEFSSFKVYCDMTSKNGVGVTVIGHDSEARMKVNGFESPGSYNRKIKYDVSMGKITTIIKTSKECQQFIKYQCYHSFLYLNSNTPTGCWVSRQGAQMKYWGGAAMNSGKCACGMTNSCAGGGSCNCDANDNVLREDSGFLTDKNTLPVTELRFGDTGATNEYGYHTLGKLLCWG